jgi:hypothetical protein
VGLERVFDGFRSFFANLASVADADAASRKTFQVARASL